MAKVRKRINPALEKLWPRERRLILEGEARLRQTGKWGPWERVTFRRGAAGSGWAAEFTVAYKNLVFCVLSRMVGNVRHLAVNSLSGIRPTWHEMQRIKDEIAGSGMTAVEIYPPADAVVDGADTFHLWILPGPLDFIFGAKAPPPAAAPAPSRAADPARVSGAYREMEEALAAFEYDRLPEQWDAYRRAAHHLEFLTKNTEQRWESIPDDARKAACMEQAEEDLGGDLTDRYQVLSIALAHWLRGIVGEPAP